MPSGANVLARPRGHLTPPVAARKADVVVYTEAQLREALARPRADGTRGPLRILLGDDILLRGPLTVGRDQTLIDGGGHDLTFSADGDYFLGIGADDCALRDLAVRAAGGAAATYDWYVAGDRMRAFGVQLWPGGCRLVGDNSLLVGCDLIGSDSHDAGTGNRWSSCSFGSNSLTFGAVSGGTTVAGCTLLANAAAINAGTELNFGATKAAAGVGNVA